MNSYLLHGEQTDRLRLRKLVYEDFDSWLPLFEKVQVAAYFAMSDELTPFQQCEKWFEKSMSRYKEEKGGMNVLLEKESGNFIGQAGLLVQEFGGNTHLEIGYSLLPDYWGKGYATEIARFLKNEAFRAKWDLDFGNRLISVIHNDNKSSINVALRNGMQPAEIYPQKGQESFTVYEITRQRYSKLP